MTRASGILLAALGFLAMGPPGLPARGRTASPARGSAGPTGDVTAVSVVSAPGRAEVVIDVRGPVMVSDFLLRSPDRVVLDLAGARLLTRAARYDGINRAGIRNVRYSQFRPDIVRVVIELEAPKDYEIAQGDEGVRIRFAAEEGFDAWSTDARRAAPRPTPPAAAAPLPSLPSSAPAPLPAAIPRAAPQPSQQPRISVTFDNASINEVIASFAAFSGRSIITGKDIAGTVTAEIRDQPWDLAFYAILMAQGLAVSVLPGGILRVDSRANLVVQDSLEPLTTTRIKINYARAAALEPTVRAVVSKPRGSAVADTITNSIIVTDLRTHIDSVVVPFVRSLDERTAQVSIQAKIIFVNRTDLEELGLRYDLGTETQFFNQLVQRPDLATDPTGATPFGRDVRIVNLGGNAVSAIANAAARFGENPALELIYSTVIGNFALSTFLEALQQVSLSDVQAEPQITVVDNRQATIFVGERTPIRQVDVAAAATGAAIPRATTQIVDTGIKLEVTPHVVAGTRQLLLEIHAERSGVEASATAEIGFIFTSQYGTTQLLVNDGETAVIGGLTVTEVTVAKSGIPFLLDLPIIGRLFGFRTSREQRRDLLILVTPHIVDDLAGPAGPAPAQRP